MLQRDKGTTMLGRELDMLMSERQTLLQVVGAAAAMIASLDSRSLPPGAMQSADLLATALNALPEETLKDALAEVRVEIEKDAPVVSN